MEEQKIVVSVKHEGAYILHMRYNKIKCNKLLGVLPNGKSEIAKLVNFLYGKFTVVSPSKLPVDYNQRIEKLSDDLIKCATNICKWLIGKFFDEKQRKWMIGSPAPEELVLMAFASVDTQYQYLDNLEMDVYLDLKNFFEMVFHCDTAKIYNLLDSYVRKCGPLTAGDKGVYVKPWTNSYKISPKRPVERLSPHLASTPVAVTPIRKTSASIQGERSVSRLYEPVLSFEDRNVVGIYSRYMNRRIIWGTRNELLLARSRVDMLLLADLIEQLLAAKGNSSMITSVMVKFLDVIASINAFWKLKNDLTHVYNKYASGASAVSWARANAPSKSFMLGAALSLPATPYKRVPLLEEALKKQHKKKVDATVEFLLKNGPVLKSEPEPVVTLIQQGDTPMEDVVEVAPMKEPEPEQVVVIVKEGDFLVKKVV